MWLLKKLNDGATKYLISGKKLYTVGRRNCDFTLEDDASISRKHCTIYIAKQSECPFPVNTITGVWIVDEQSKYGTYLMVDNDWVKINPNENKKLTNGSVIKFGLMGNIWSLEFKPTVACASGIPAEQKRNIEGTLRSVDGFLRNAWCKECSLVIVNEITLTVKVVLALINGVPIVTPSYIQKLVESVKNQGPLPSYEDYIPEIKETVLDKKLVSLDSKNHRKELFKGMKFVIPTKKQLETLKEVITTAGGSVELLSSNNKLESFAEDNVVVLQLPLNNSGIPKELCELFKDVSSVLKNKFGRRIVPESEIAQAVAYSSTEKFCNPVSTCFVLKIGEPKQVDLGPVLVEETPVASNVSSHSGHGVIPSSETVETEPYSNRGAQSQSQCNNTVASQQQLSTTQRSSTERKRSHSPNEVDHECQKKKARSRTSLDCEDKQMGPYVHSLANENTHSGSQSAGKSIPDKENPSKESSITNYLQNKNKQPPEEKTHQLVRQASSSFWNLESSLSKPIKRKISPETDDSEEESGLCRKKSKPSEMNASKGTTPEVCIDTPREVVEVLQPKSSGESASFPIIRRVTVEEEDDHSGYFGRDIEETVDLQVDELNNTIFSLKIISPAFLKEDGTLIDPPSVPVNVKRFKKQKIFSKEVFNSWEELDDELSEGEWIEPHSDRFNISVVEGEG